MGQAKSSDSVRAELAALKEAYSSLESRLKEEVTAHACTQEVLRDCIGRGENEDKLRLVLENMPVMMNAFDADGVCVAWNRECERVTGFSVDEMFGNPHSLALIVPNASYREQMTAEWAGKGDHRDWEWELTAKNGRKLIVEWSNISDSFPVRGWATWGIGVDTTERNLALLELESARVELEERVRDRTAQLQGVLDNIADGVVTIDSSGVIETFNPAAEKMFGYADREVTGKNISILMPEPDHSRHDNYLDAYIDTGEGKIVDVGPREVTAQRRDGSLFPMELSVGEMVIGDRRMFVGAMRDISSRKDADAAIRESQEMLSGFMNSATDNFMILDRDLMVVDVNAIVASRKGCSREDLIGKSFAETSPESVPPGGYDAYKAVLATGRPYSFELTGERLGREIQLSGTAFRIGTNRLGIASHDVTELMAANRALKRSEARFRDIVETSSDWIWETDAENRHSYASERLKEVLGVAAKDLIGQSLGSSDQFPDEAETWKQHLVDLKERRPFTDYVFRVRGADNTVRVIKTSGKPVFDAEGTFRGYRGTGTDITDRQRALDAVKESERRLLDSQRIARIGTFEHDLVTDQVTWSDEAFRLLGYEPGEVEASIANYVERLHPDDLEIVRQGQAAIKMGRHPEDSVRRVIWPDGSVHMLHSVAGVERNRHGEPVRVTRTLQDITDRVAAEHALRSSQSMFERAFASSPGLASIVSLGDGRLLKVNDVWCQRLGFEREEVIGRTTDELGIWRDEHAKERVREEVEKNGFVRAFPTTMLAARGDTIHVEIFADALEFEGGKALFTVAHDRTERKHYEDALWEAKENAELANRTKSEFLANVSHELRTPLNAILGFSDLMAMGVPGPPTEKQSEYLADIRSSGEHLLSLIGDVIDLSTIELGKMTLTFEPVRLHDCVTECVTQVVNKIEGSGLRLSVSNMAELPPVRGDKRRIKQVLLNILSNAAKFTDPGGEITVEGAETSDGNCAIAIADTGEGMTQEMIHQALTAFKRGDDPMLRNVEGIGLGLSLVQSMVEAHGGSVTIKSTVGVGTKVTVAFPIDGPEGFVGRPSHIS